MDIKKIEILLRALELKSLAGAAEEYNYTPSALSHMTDSLEKELGIKLIKRGFTGIEPEENAEEILALMKGIAETYNKVRKKADKLREEKNTLNLGTYASLSRYFLPEITRRFMEAYPEIKLNINVVNDTVPLMESGEADVIIAEEPEIPGWEWKPLSEDYYAAVLPLGYRGREKEFSREKKYDYPFVLAEDRKTAAYMKRENYKDVIKVRSDDDGTVIDMVAAGAGIAILPLLSLSGAEERVKILPLDPPLKRTLGIAYKKEAGNNPAVRSFVGYLLVRL